ncbi:YugN family protein [Paenibacillus sp. LHD-38]|uniref:YugN family protein n=1 Tax=Paenibacillus sp. LHD-38 TaxID=3072143 RepID=UPI00280C6C5B|nr:YugN family protein [Paenibacillus sp. LHD-38]MDQ8738409.1 YugN family protein [Paenibacillus sp. LHD-38]
MIPISSVLESREQHFLETKELLETQRFTLGGNWEYDRGSFDRSLDEGHKVWLRIPFEVVAGHIDVSEADNEATIKLGTPYVLKHLYREGNDPEASVRVVGALFDQFQAPADPDAHVDPKWIDRAKEALHDVEQLFPH